MIAYVSQTSLASLSHTFGFNSSQFRLPYENHAMGVYLSSEMNDSHQQRMFRGLFRKLVIHTYYVHMCIHLYSQLAKQLFWQNILTYLFIFLLWI